jgi:hypothetical protein
MAADACLPAHRGRSRGSTAPTSTSSPNESYAAHGREREIDRERGVCRSVEMEWRRKAEALVADLAHQPLRCTTSPKRFRFKRVPGLSGRSAG